ncbi:LacI family DNA-binding transcriptional regulator [Arthrobacter sp. NPDC057388]|uniref:LacI family DNA-binding transcriptional regulator n=1 Tax=Arthrobacter sp. NPDC057388 TaxID=3346116 RepID=UPI00362F77B2
MTETNASPLDRQLNIADIAAMAGVATSTVSRALSNPDRVNAKTREKIEKIAADMGYVPSGLARGLRMGRTGIIAVLVPDVSNVFSFGIVRGTQNQLKAAGYTQVLVNTEQENGFELEAMQKLRRTSDGVILGSSSLTDEQLSELAAIQPLVTINRPAPNTSSVLIDTSAGMAEAMKHLASLGHTSVTYVGGPATSWSSKSRWESIQQAALDLRMTAQMIGPYPASAQSGIEAAEKLAKVNATAAIAFNDVMAISMLQRFAELGLSVPKDISLVGCDDIYGSDFCNPPLTTISTPIEKAGHTAVEMLLARLDSKRGASPAELTSLPAQLVIRGSTGQVPG